MKALALALLLAGPALAEPVALRPGTDAAQTAQYSSPATTYRLLTGAWTPEGGAATALEGARTDTAWRLRANQQTTLQILAPLRAQIEAAGYTLLYECATDDCGGFDFRYALDLVQEPQMHIDLGDFRYLAARRGGEWLALTVSRSSESGFVNLTTVAQGAITAAVPDNGLAPPPARPATVSDFGTRIEAQGVVALDDLVFKSGATTLDTREFDSMRALADYLATRPTARIVLVGHTDTTGSLDANIAVSRKRAEAVRNRLVQSYGVNAAQVTAEGAGWLAPRASNLTPEGQERNRRVEVVLTALR
ncbi:OmpA family protein [Paenirhodobacter sp.]|uniref:OmpA family protein n=1 Tax=Paenirhodobacter sp. TaxID=1965326 RepID=UPI003B3DF9ED